MSPVLIYAVRCVKGEMVFACRDVVCRAVSMKSPKHIPTKELLESTHEFPGVYTVKAIGLAKGPFLARVVSITRETLGASQDPGYTQRESAGGEYVAVTLDFQVESSQQVIDVYRAILEVPELHLLF